MRIRSPKTRGLGRLIALWRKPQRHFEAKGLAEYRVALSQTIVNGGYLAGPCCGPLVIRAQERKPVLVELLRFFNRVRVGRIFTKAVHIHCENVAFRFTLDHPLR